MVSSLGCGRKSKLTVFEALLLALSMALIGWAALPLH
jgi:hypothetical protein